MPLKACEELLQVGEQVEADQALEDPEHHPGAAAGDLHPDPGRLHEHLHRLALDELGQAARGVEEVERVAARRGVEHQQVEAALRVQLEQLLHRHVLLRPGQRVGDLLVDAVREDPLAGLLVGGVAAHELVEGRLGVEHHRPQLPLHLDPLALDQGRVDAPCLIAELLEAERVGEALGRVDRQHADLQAPGGHPGGDCRRGGRLSDPARARADADVLALEDVGDRGHLRRSGRRAGALPPRPARAQR